MNDDAVDRIRSATFPSARKGYDRTAVDRFLDELADSLAGAPAGGEGGRPADLVRRELERIGESTTAILTDAHDAAESMRRDAEQRVRQQLADANLRAEALQAEADEYAERIREEADAYARKTRAAAEGFAAEAREKAERETERLLADAQRRRGDIESAISELESRRDAVIDQLRRLVDQVGGANAGERVAPAATEGPAQLVSERRRVAANDRRSSIAGGPGTPP